MYGHEGLDRGLLFETIRLSLIGTQETGSNTMLNVDVAPGKTSAGMLRTLKADVEPPLSEAS